jgi:hypothetical protein
MDLKTVGVQSWEAMVLAQGLEAVVVIAVELDLHGFVHFVEAIEIGAVF